MQDPIAPTTPALDDALSAQAVAHAYRSLMWWVIVQHLCALGAFSVFRAFLAPLMGVTGFLAGSSLVAIARLGVILCAIMQATQAQRLSRQLGSPRPNLWAFAMAVPVANILALLHLSEKVSAHSRAAGLEFSALGPTLAAWNAWRARSRASVQYPAAAPAAPTPQGPDSYIRDARAARMGDDDIVAALVASGWEEAQARELVGRTLNSER